jgi:hypothetical protein
MLTRRLQNSSSKLALVRRATTKKKPLGNAERFSKGETPSSVMRRVGIEPTT